MKGKNTFTHDISRRKKIYTSVLQDISSNEGRVWGLHTEMRKKFESSYPELFSMVPIVSTQHAHEKSFEVITRTLDFFDGITDFQSLEPAHGIGHLTRDYLHASILLESTDIDPKHAYIGMIGATLHDILGCTLMSRYQEQGRVIKHAEAGGYLFHQIHKSIGVSDVESLMVQYAIAAHTNSRVESVIECSDGVRRKVTPYTYTEKQGNPILSTVLPIWADRLDANGPCFIGRHFLTMAEDHHDTWVGDAIVTFSSHMRPLLRPEEDIKKDPYGATMREHVMRFLVSQSNSSFYGRFDFGEMVRLRDLYKQRAMRIMNAFDVPFELSGPQENMLLDTWTEWLCTCIEPSQSGKNAANQLKKMFQDLPLEIRKPWLHVMQMTLQEHKEWLRDMREILKSIPEERKILPILGNLESMISGVV